MSQTPANETPIFDQLALHLAARGTSYDDLVNWSVPEFQWGPERSVVPLDKPRRGISLKRKHIREGLHCSCGVVWPCSIGAEAATAKILEAIENPKGIDAFGLSLAVKVGPMMARVATGVVHADVLEANGIELPKRITGINDRPELLADHKEIQDLKEETALLQQQYIDSVGRAFAEHHPLAIVTDMHTEMNEDGSETVVYEAVQPITSVMPLSEKNTAKPME